MAESCDGRVRNGWVYFIGEGFMRPVKIGWAADTARRLFELQVASPAQLLLLAQQAGTVGDERALHHWFGRRIRHPRPMDAPLARPLTPDKEKAPPPRAGR